MAFTRKHLTATFQLGRGSFGNSGFDTITVSGLRIDATIEKTAGVAFPSLEMSVYGLTLNLMNKLTTIGKQLTDQKNNLVTLNASEDGGPSTVVFIGNIYQAYAQFDGAESSLVITAVSAGVAAIAPVAPTSFKGSVDVALVMSHIAQASGHNFENDGVSVKLSNPYFAGTAAQQMQLAAAAANINATIDLGTLAIWPKNGSRGGKPPSCLG
jgi:hypothetical protein